MYDGSWCPNGHCELGPWADMSYKKTIFHALLVLSSFRNVRTAADD